MPRIYRVMTLDGDGPRIGPSKRCLGVKPGSGKLDDIKPDDDGNVSPRTGGMSVAPQWRDLPMHRIPRRLESKVPYAAGNNNDCCWRMGEGEFAEEIVGEDLILRPDKLDAKKERVVHGCVEPTTMMPLTRLQVLLAQTRDEWMVDED